MNRAGPPHQWIRSRSSNVCDMKLDVCSMKNECSLFRKRNLLTFDAMLTCSLLVAGVTEVVVAVEAVVLFMEFILN